MDDLAQLKSRVEAARGRLGDAEADQRKYGLRLDDLVRIVDGALSRQLTELEAVKSKAAALEIELEVARNAVSRGELDLAARETDLAKVKVENEQLRSMVMTLLELVEGRNVTPLRESMLRLEKGVRHLLTETGSAAPVSQAEPAIRPAPIDTAAAAPRAQTPPPRPVLIPKQEIHGRVLPAEAHKAPPAIATQTDPSGDESGLVELSAFGRSNAAEIVKEPPEATAPSIRRAASDTGTGGPSLTDL